MIVKGPQPIETPRPAVSRAQLRSCLIEMWAQIFEAELRAHLAAEAADDQQDDAASSAAHHGGR